MKTFVLLMVFAASLAACAGPSSPGGGPSPAASPAVRPYPLDTCLVTGSALGSMGDPVTIVHRGQEMKFCCEPCVAEFQADPDRFLKQLP